LQCQRAIEARDGVLVAVKAKQCVPATGERLDNIWLDGKHLVEVRERLFVLPQRHQDQAAIAAGRRGIFLRLQCSAEGLKRLVVTALLIADHAEEMQRAEMTFVCSEDLQAELLGLGHMTGLMKRERA